MLFHIIPHDPTLIDKRICVLRCSCCHGKYYKREKVIQILKRKMNKFYENYPAAWQELLDSRGNASPVALAKGCTASPGPTGTEQPRNEDIDD